MNDERAMQLIAYRMDEAKEALRDAENLFSLNSNRGCANRAYYAMFYAVMALLITKKLGTSKHSAVIELFNREFVHKGHFNSFGQSPKLRRSSCCILGERYLEPAAHLNCTAKLATQVTLG